MKTFVRVIAMVILSIMVLSLVACSSFGGIKSSFEKNGYTYVENANSDSTAKKITAEMEQGEISCTPHLFKGEGKGLFGGDVYAFVLEFDSDADMNKAIEESGTISGLIKDVQKSDLVKRNCLLIPISLTQIDEMIEIFQG